MTETYICSACNGEFEKGWSDEEAQAEYEATFTKEERQDGQSVVCDGCYQAMGLGDHAAQEK